MQDRHDRDLTEFVMLGAAFQTSRVMESLHDKACIRPDPDIFAFDNPPRASGPNRAMSIKCKSVWVWKNATCDAAFGFQKNLYCVSSKGNVIFATRIGHLSCEIGIKNPSKNL